MPPATMVDDMSTASTVHPQIVFVCTGNICRSPMAEVIVRQALKEEDIVAEVSSCGLGGWHVGQQADRRALRELERAGYDGSGHRAAQLGSQHEQADLFVALAGEHVAGLRREGIDSSRIRLLKSFDPAAVDEDVEDPYYGGPAEFVRTREEIEAAVPGIVDWVRAAVRGSE